jgi:ABC-type phosphonate transport system ATPase subunit
MQQHVSMVAHYCYGTMGCQWIYRDIFCAVQVVLVADSGSGKSTFLAQLVSVPNARHAYSLF